MGGEVVHHHPDDRGVGIIDIDQLAHALGEVLVGAPVGDLHPAPGAVGVEEDEQIDGAVAAIFAVVALKPTLAPPTGVTSACSRSKTRHSTLSSSRSTNFTLVTSVLT